jgi:hypothetical protein
MLARNSVFAQAAASAVALASISASRALALGDVLQCLDRAITGPACRQRRCGENTAVEFLENSFGLEAAATAGRRMLSGKSPGPAAAVEHESAITAGRG